MGAHILFLCRVCVAQREKDLTVYIHPVPPVMDITRPVVRQWNEMLGARLTSGKDKGSALRWLDFWERLLRPEDGQFAPEYTLDSIHMHPAYLALLQEAYNKVCDRPMRRDPTPEEDMASMGALDVDD